MIFKPTKEHKRTKLYYSLHNVYLLHVSANHTAIFRKLHYNRQIQQKSSKFLNQCRNVKY